METKEDTILLTNDMEVKEEVESKKVCCKKKRGALVLVLEVLLAVVVMVFASFYISDFIRGVCTVTIKKVNDVRFQVDEYFRLRYASKNQDNGIQIDQESLKDAVKRYSQKYGVNPLVAWAIIEPESAGRFDRIRYEQSWKDGYSAQIKKEPWMNDIEYSLYFCSIGVMQVGYGIHREECGLRSFSDLLSVDKSLDCGLKIMSGCLQRNAGVHPKGERLRLCFKEYNGKGPKAEQYANERMARLADFMLEDSKDFMPEQVKLSFDRSGLINRPWKR